MKPPVNATLIERFIFYMDNGKKKTANRIEVLYNYLEDCYMLDEYVEDPS